MTFDPTAAWPAPTRRERSRKTPGGEAEPRTRSYLQPGKIFVGKGPAVVKTVLGSCVSVCLWDAERGIGGLNHYLLPLRATRHRASPRFGEVAIRSLIEELERLGARSGNLRARIYGGACVVDTLRERGAGVGPRNIELAVRMLGALRIPIVSQDVGGRSGRRLVFRVGDGAVWLRHLDQGRRR